MSQENVELVRAIWPSEVDVVQLVQLVEEGELPADVVAGVASDLEVAFIAQGPQGSETSYRGVEGLGEGWRDWLEPYQSYWLEVEDFIDAGEDEVLMPARVKAVTRRDGVLIEHSPAAICAVRDRKIARVTFYLDRSEALEAVGLRE